MIKCKLLKKTLSVAVAATMLGATLFTGNTASTASAATSDPLISNKECDSTSTYIQTFMQSDYLKDGYNAFELKYEYLDLGTLEGNEEVTSYNDTFRFLVFDSNWGGWIPTSVGLNDYDKTGAVTPELGVEYTVRVPFRAIERKLPTGTPALGINLELAPISDCKVKIHSLSYTEVEVDSESVVMEGAWHKTNNASDTEAVYGSMKVTDGFAYVSTNPWNIGVSGLDVHQFSKPIIAVTVEYGEIANAPIYPQAEVLGADGTPIKANYPQVSEAGEVTYLTNIPQSTKSVTLAYDTCTVKKVEIYDEGESYVTTVNDLTNENIIKNMGAGWNLGNALESVSDDGKTGETLWGNPVINKRTFKLVAAAGFKTVRIPLSFVDAVKVNGDSYTIDETRFNAILARVKEVVDMARDYDLFVVIGLQHDGSEGVTGMWLDVDAANQKGIRDAFADVWGRIANEFKDYDQHLIFESMNEVMESGNYGTPKDTTWDNINYLNQSFVDVVRGIDGNNATRFLLVPGYNTNIDQTVTDMFVLPQYNNSSERIMVSVHFYDPYDFTLNTGAGSKTTLSFADINAIGTQFGKLKTKFVDKGIPVVVGEIGAMNKNNLTQIQRYLSEVVAQAKANGLGYIYWDNGYTGENGMGLWNRYTYAQSELGKTVLPILP